ncbi:glycosyltransferase family 2 protein [Glycocaulis sp.]|uniref:glycosyltransferase family 2 protein n=1 Tax=Glycocaulis sp. TaxID=1969725 RepID=UPI003D1ED379
MTARSLSLLVPVLNEEESIGTFLDACQQPVEEALEMMGENASVEWLFINDGSTDATAAVILARREKDSRIKLVNFSRNFGKEAALAAGIDHACGDAIIPMDVDLQDPPALIVPMVRAWLDGAEVVNARRSDRSSDSWFKRSVANIFYYLYNRLAEHPIPDNVGDFRLLGRQAIEVIRNLPERSRFNKGLFNWVGFPTATIEYARPPRAAGKTKWKVWQLWNLALDGIVASTSAPLRIWTYVGAFFALLAFGYAFFLAIRTLLFGTDVPGYASVMVAILMLGGLQLLSLGVLGEYIGRIANEVRQRPLYVISSKFGV